MSLHSAQTQQLEAIRAGDRSAFQAVFRLHYPEVVRVVYRYLPDPGLSEDLAQEVFVRFWNKREDIHIESNIGAYLRRMGVNEALAYLRKKNRFQADELPLHLPGQTAPAADEATELNELKDRIAQAVDRLPPRCRLIFKLSRYEDLSNKEIAAQLGLSVKTIENQMTKALKMLRASLPPLN